MQVAVEKMPSGSESDVAWFDPDILSELGVAEDDVVELVSARGRRLLARARGRPEDRGRGVVRVDRFQIRLLKPAVAERLEVAPAQVEEARRLVLEPLAPLGDDLAAVERRMAKVLAQARQLAQRGTLLQVKADGEVRPTLYRVADVDPGNAFVSDHTRILVRATALSPGVAANLVTFDDVGGLGRELDVVRELVECPLKYPHVYDALGVEPPRGILFYGPPGVGKTYLARAMANEIGAHFLYVNGPELVSSLHGGTEANLRRVFEEAKDHAPSVVLIDELDSIAPQRADTGSQADIRVGSQLLTLLDGLVALDDVVVIGTTNRVNALDPALRRPGRLDREVFIGPPDAGGRLEILHIHTRRVPLDESALAFLPRLAEMTHGYVGADLMELVRRAALSALRRHLGAGFRAAEAWEPDATAILVSQADLTAAMEETRPSALRETPLRTSGVGWEDVGGLEAVKDFLRTNVQVPFAHPEACARLGVRASTGVLLVGPPGTGKTLLVHALARECGVNFVEISGPEVYSKWLGESEERIRHAFALARQVAPTILFFDHLEAVAPHRGTDALPAAAERVIHQFLLEMDALGASSRVVVVGATSALDQVDAAVLGPGGFGTQVPVEPPDLDDRAAILAIALHRAPLAPRSPWEQAIGQLAELTAGFSGADMVAAVEESKRRALQRTGFSDDTWLEVGDVLQSVEALRASRDRLIPK